jgi:hypothetical protein
MRTSVVPPSDRPPKQGNRWLEQRRLASAVNQEKARTADCQKIVSQSRVFEFEHRDLTGMVLRGPGSSRCASE